MSMTINDYKSEVKKSALAFLVEHFDEFGTFADAMQAMANGEVVHPGVFWKQACENVAMLAWEKDRVSEFFQANLLRDDDAAWRESPICLDIALRLASLNCVAPSLHEAWEVISFEREFGMEAA